MRKTNNKEVKKAIREYLSEMNDCSIPELKEKFFSEYGWKIASIGEINACIDWLRGLGCNVAFCYDAIAQLLAEWLCDTKENQEKWLEKKGDDLYWLLLAREIVKG